MRLPDMGGGAGEGGRERDRQKSKGMLFYVQLDREASDKLHSDKIVKREIYNRWMWSSIKFDPSF